MIVNKHIFDFNSYQAINEGVDPGKILRAIFGESIAIQLEKRLAREGLEHLAPALEKFAANRHNWVMKDGAVFIKSKSGAEVPLEYLEKYMTQASKNKDLIEVGIGYLPRNLADGTEFRQIIKEGVSVPKKSISSTVTKTAAEEATEKALEVYNKNVKKFESMYISPFKSELKEIPESASYKSTSATEITFENMKNRNYRDYFDQVKLIDEVDEATRHLPLNTNNIKVTNKSSDKFQSSVQVNKNTNEVWKDINNPKHGDDWVLMYQSRRREIYEIEIVGTDKKFIMYGSSGSNVATTGKDIGEWFMIPGFASGGPYGKGWFIKTPESVALAKGGNPYLTWLANHLESGGSISTKL